MHILFRSQHAILSGAIMALARACPVCVCANFVRTRARMAAVSASVASVAKPHGDEGKASDHLHLLLPGIKAW